MNKSAAVSDELGRMVGVLVIAFALIKLLMFVFQADLIRHLAVALVLFCVPLFYARSMTFFYPTIVSRARHWGGLFFCSIYAVLPWLPLFVLHPQLVRSTVDNLSAWMFSTAGLAAIVLAPVSEEIFFRGWLLNEQSVRSLRPSNQSIQQRNWKRLFWTCYFNALVFWVFHIPISDDFFAVMRHALSMGMVPLSPGPFLLGFFCAVLTVMTGTPRAAIVFHMLANALGPVWWPVLQSDSVRSFFYF